MKKRIIQAAIMILGLAALVAYVFWKEGVATLGEKLRNIDYTYIALALVSVNIAMVADGLSIHILRRRFQSDATLRSSIHCAYVSTMFGFVTPFQAGYVAYAITYLSSSQGMKPSDASAVTLKKLIFYTLGSVLVQLSLILTNTGAFDLPGIIWILAFIGLGCTSLYVVFLSIVPRFSKAIGAIATALIRFAGRIRIIKEPEAVSEKARDEINSIRTNIQKTRMDFRSSALLFITCCISFMSLYMISYFVYLSFHPQSPLTLPVVLTGQVLCTIIQQISPIPGGIGIVDTAFGQVMGTIYSGNLNVAMLLWRLISLYAVIVIGFILLFTEKRKSKLK